MMQNQPKRHIRLGSDGELLEPVEVPRQTIDEVPTTDNSSSQPQEGSGQDPIPSLFVTVLIVLIWIMVAVVQLGSLSPKTPFVLSDFLRDYFMWGGLYTLICFFAAVVIDVAVIRDRTRNAAHRLFLRAVWKIIYAIWLVPKTAFIAFWSNNTEDTGDE